MQWTTVYDQAITQAERVIAIDPNRAEGYAWLGNILNFAGKPHEIGTEKDPLHCACPGIPIIFTDLADLAMPDFCEYLHHSMA